MADTYLSFDALMGAPDARAVERDVTIDGLGVMRVRALSLHEYWRLQENARQKGSFDNERWQADVLSHGMVKPVLSYDDAWRLGDKAYGLVAILVDAIVGLTMVTPLGAITQEAVNAAEASFQG